jgi:hypothetical protein
MNSLLLLIEEVAQDAREGGIDGTQFWKVSEELKLCAYIYSYINILLI